MGPVSFSMLVNETASYYLNCLIFRYIAILAYLKYRQCRTTTVIKYRILPRISDRLLRVKPEGDVYVSIRLSLSLACHMRLAKFPMDMQVRAN